MRMYQGPLPVPGARNYRRRGGWNGAGRGIHPPVAWLPPVARAQNWNSRPNESKDISKDNNNSKAAEDKKRDKNANLKSSICIQTFASGFNFLSLLMFIFIISILYLFQAVLLWLNDRNHHRLKREYTGGFCFCNSQLKLFIIFQGYPRCQWETFVSFGRFRGRGKPNGKCSTSSRC